jgi:integrase
VHPATLTERWQAPVKRAGVTPITLHGARHTFAELSLQGGARLDIVSRALGHASVTTTGIYLHDDETAAAEAAEMLGDILERRAR